MYEKKLNPSTIVPTTLYVERDADRQVETVLSHMGRPGYVLVARQMGKTNLLINAKRKFENDHDVFVYIDLSNIYKTSRECFRNFIDTAIDTHPEAFSSIEKNIYKERNTLNLEPHQEHHRELKILLKAITGKLVFILDEVDALTKTNYSDEIFAQIRSIYFSRINFKESERLTYLLSGVAEPSELIKDKNISPFNIGQKIYLDDFSYDEFIIFITNTKISFSPEVIERVFYWSNGNPRITWDICSEIEDLMVKKENVISSDVDWIVNKLYLKAFDRPPVDHIRSIVEKDKEVRNAIVEIRYSKGSSLSDSIKSRLYLSGIIGGYIHDNEIVIKNKIIDTSLSDKYIDELETKGKGTLLLGIEKYLANEYSEALDYFSKFLAEAQPVDSATQAEIYYKMGNSAYLLNNMVDAKKYLEKSAFHSRKKQSDIYFDSNYLLGLCEYYSGNNNRAMEFYNLVLKADRHDISYFKSLLALSSSIQTEKSVDESIKLVNQLLNELHDEYNKDSENDYLDIRISAYHNLGYMYIEAKQFEEAEKSFNQGLSIAPEKYKAKLYLGQIRVASDSTSKSIFLEKFKELMPKLSLLTEGNTRRRTLELDYETFYSLIVSSIEAERFDIYEDIIKELYAKDPNFTSISMSLFTLADYSMRSKKERVAIYFLSNILNNYDEACDKDSNVYHKASKMLYANELNLATPDKSATNITLAENVYCKLILNDKLKLDYDLYDIYISSRLAFKFLNIPGKNRSVRRLIEISELVVNNLDDSYRINYSWIYFLRMLQEDTIGEAGKAIEYAQRVIDNKKSCGDDEMKKSVLSEKEINILVEYAKKNFSDSKKVQPPLLKQMKYGRNQIVSVKYNNGKTVTTKYKKISDDLQRGDCVMVLSNLE